MISKLVCLIVSIPVFAFGQVYKKYTLLKDHLSIQLSEGVLNITPISDKAIRIQWEKGMKEEREFVLINKQTDLRQFKNELKWNDVYYQLNKD